MQAVTAGNTPSKANYLSHPKFWSTQMQTSVAGLIAISVVLCAVALIHVLGETLWVYPIVAGKHFCSKLHGKFT